MQHKNTVKGKIIYKIIGKIIQEERLAQNKSMRLLADEYDIQKSMLSRLENGQNEPKLISVLTICEALNLKPYDLFKRMEKFLPENFSLIDD